MNLGDVVRFKLGDAILMGILHREAVIPNWYVIRIEKPKGFNWRNDDPFYVTMPAEALEVIEK